MGDGGRQATEHTQRVIPQAMAAEPAVQVRFLSTCQQAALTPHNQQGPHLLMNVLPEDVGATTNADAPASTASSTCIG